MNPGDLPLLLRADHKILGNEYCSGYADVFGQWNTGFYCPQSESKTAISCCGSTTFKYCCTINESTSSSSSGSDVETSNEIHNLPFLVRSPIISGVVTGFLLILVFFVIGSCYFYSCCLFSRKPYFSSVYSGLYRLHCNSMSKSNSSTSRTSRNSSLLNPGTSPLIQSMVVCREFPPNNQHQTERHVPLLYNQNPSIQSSLGADYSSSSRNLASSNTLTVNSHNQTNIISRASPLSAAFTVNLSSTQQPNKNLPNPNQLHFQNINQVPMTVPNKGNMLHYESSAAANKRERDKSESPCGFPILKIPPPIPGSIAAASMDQQKRDNYFSRNTGPELLIHCPMLLDDTNTNTNLNRNHKYSYSTATLPLLRNPNSYNNDYCDYRSKDGRHSAMNYNSYPDNYEYNNYSYHNYYNNGNCARPYNTLNLRSSAESRASHPYHNPDGARIHKSILKKPDGTSSTSAINRSNNFNSAGTNDDSEPISYYVKEGSSSGRISSTSTTQPDIIQTRYLYSSFGSSNDHQLHQPQSLLVGESSKEGPAVILHDVVDGSECEVNNREVHNNERARQKFMTTSIGDETFVNDINMTCSRERVINLRQRQTDSFESESDLQPEVEKDTFL